MFDQLSVIEAVQHQPLLLLRVPPIQQVQVICRQLVDHLVDEVLDLVGVASQCVGSKGHWVADCASEVCMRCQVRFSVLNRKHHCRQCGALVCDSCSPKKLLESLSPVRKSAGAERVRICTACLAPPIQSVAQPTSKFPQLNLALFERGVPYEQVVEAAVQDIVSGYSLLQVSLPLLLCIFLDSFTVPPCTLRPASLPHSQPLPVPLPLDSSGRLWLCLCSTWKCSCASHSPRDHQTACSRSVTQFQRQSYSFA